MSTSSRQSFDPSTTGVWAFTGSSFAGVMLTTVAAFQILEGIAALAEDSVYVSGLQYTYEFDVTAWGWIHLIVGIVGVVVGVGILMARSWAYVTGIAVAGVSAVANFAFLPYYPFWAVVVIAFNAFVIWALCTQLSRGERTVNM